MTVFEPQDSPPISTEERDKSWAEQNSPVLSRVIEIFLLNGKWSSADDIQRLVDRQNSDSKLVSAFDVQQVFQTMPRFPGEMYYPQMQLQEVRIPLRFFIYFDFTADLLGVCNILVKRAVEIYFSDIEPAVLTNTDPNIQSLTSTVSAELVMRAVELLVNDYPSPISGGGWGSDQWSLGINGSMARQFRNLDSIQDYFSCQRQIRNENYERSQPLRNSNIPPPMPPPPPHAAPVPPPLPHQGRSQDTNPTRKTIFVLMPITTDWSQGIYEFIKRSVNQVKEFIFQVIRADEINQPGHISSQIVEAIANCNLIIADITDCNPNVMWELGYAQALKRGCVIINQKVADSPFDLSDIRQLQYRLTPTEDDEAKLVSFIKEVISANNADESS